MAAMVNSNSKSDGELRRKVIEKGKRMEGNTNNLSKIELRHINAKLRFKQMSREFRLQCIRDLEDSGMPVADFLATMIHGNWEDYGETEEEIQAAREVIRRWTKHYLKARDVDDFMHKLGYDNSKEAHGAIRT